MVHKVNYRRTRGHPKGGWYTLARATPKVLLDRLGRKGGGRSGREVWMWQRLKESLAYTVVWDWCRYRASNGERVQTRRLAILPMDTRLRQIRGLPGY